MKKWNYIWTDMLVGVLMGAASIIICHLLSSCSSGSEQAETPTAPSIAPSQSRAVTLRLSCTDYLPATRAQGSVKGVEGIPAGSIQIFCFDANSHFLGMAQAVSNTPSTSDGKLQTVSATIPSQSATLHLLANAHVQAQEEWLGKTEQEVMSQMESRYDTHEHLVYWGYVSQGSTEQMKAFLENTSSTISMLRDRAKVTCLIQDSDILQAEIALCNGLATGMMWGDTSEGSASSELSGSPVLHLPSDPSLRIDNTEGDFSPTAFTFEHPNRPGDYLRAIVRATYRNGSVRYHHICLENDLHEPYAIFRNHEYRINIIKLSQTAGYADFEGAKTGDASNNAFVTVDDIVPEVSDGTHSLLINGGTSVVYNTGAAPQQVIHFTYTEGSQLTASSFKAEWIGSQELALDAAPQLTYDASTGKGEIHFQLNALSPELKTAQLHLLDTQHGLSRVIHLYSITQFALQASFQSSLGTNKLGKNKGDTGELTLQVPANYPEDLLPLDIKIASNDINPKDLGVEVSSTEDVDGTQQDPSLKPWNCWFVYKAPETGMQTVTLKNVRAATAGSEGKFFVKADYFGSPIEISFVYQ